MDNIIEKKNQTPIEIALQVDEKGMTTARRLYKFLELHSAHYSRWCNKNIEENEYAEENVDYLRLTIEGETPTGGKIARTDYKLTSSFAKKLAMASNSERGEEAREYFVKVEDTLKNVVSGLTSNISSLSPQLQLLINIELKQKQLEKQVESVEEQVDDIRDIVAITPTVNWREETKNIINKIALSLGGYKYIESVRSEIYDMLDRRYGVNLHERVRRKKERMALAGANKTAINKVNKIDVISEDKKLVEGYIHIIKELAIKHSITV